MARLVAKMNYGPTQSNKRAAKENFALKNLKQKLHIGKRSLAPKKLLSRVSQKKISQIPNFDGES